MDLRKLRHVLVLAEELNFARAAMSLHLTQPALSRSIRALEDELGCQLFDRDGQGVRVTPVGRKVAERASALLMDARNLQHEVDMMLRREVGHVRMGSGPLPLAALLPPVMAELARERPHLQIEIENHSAPVLMQMLLDGEIEFFVADLSTFTKNRRITTRRLVQETINAYCRASHPLVGRRMLSPKDLLDYPILSTRRPAAADNFLARYFGLDEALPVPIHLISDFVPLLINVTLESDAVLLAVNTAVRAELHRGAMVALNPSPTPDRAFHVGIVTLAGWTLSPAAEWLVERLEIVASRAG